MEMKSWIPIKLDLRGSWVLFLTIPLRLVALITGWLPRRLMCKTLTLALH